MWCESVCSPVHGVNIGKSVLWRSSREWCSGLEWRYWMAWISLVAWISPGLPSDTSLPKLESVPTALTQWLLHLTYQIKLLIRRDNKLLIRRDNFFVRCKSHELGNRESIAFCEFGLDNWESQDSTNISTLIINNDHQPRYRIKDCLLQQRCERLESKDAWKLAHHCVTLCKEALPLALCRNWKMQTIFLSA